jgi:hypothetical protein
LQVQAEPVGVDVAAGNPVTAPIEWRELPACMYGI